MKKLPYTQYELNYVKQNYISKNNIEIAQHLQCNINKVKSILKKLHLKRPKFQWTSDMDNYLKDNYLKYTISNLTNKVNELFHVKIKYETTRKRLKFLHLDVKKDGWKLRISDARNNWTQEQIRFVTKNSKKYTLKQLSEILGFKDTSISKALRKMGLKTKNKSSRTLKRIFTEEEKQYIEQNYPKKSFDEIAKDIGSKDLNGKNIYCYLKRIQKLKTKNPYTEGCIIQILNKNNIKYVHNKRISYHDKNYKKYNGHKGIHNFEMDFLINENKIIEIQGDYWHGNMKLYPILNEKQKCAKEKDKFKKRFFEKLGYCVYYIWEYDILHNINDVEKRILSIAQM